MCVEGVEEVCPGCLGQGRVPSLFLGVFLFSSQNIYRVNTGRCVSREWRRSARVASVKAVCQAFSWGFFSSRVKISTELTRVDVCRGSGGGLPGLPRLRPCAKPFPGGFSLPESKYLQS